jgi:RNA polymerase sigma-70 factor (ECF subfamily)
MVIQVTSVTTKGFSRYEDATDDQLVSLIQLGDDRALDCIMNRYRGLVYRVTKTYLGSMQEAEDIFQEISLSLHQNRNSYKSGPAKFSSWLYRVTINRCLDILKTTKSRKQHTELHDAIPDLAMSAEVVLQQSELLKELDELLDLLPDQQKSAISLYYCEEMDIPDIAGYMKISELAVRSLIKRGKEKMRDSSDKIATYLS